MSANETQVGGDHYRKKAGEQHWDRQWKLHGPGYFVGCITKYVERYRDKNGVEDLEKARHFLDKLIELEKGAEGNRQAKKAGVIPFTTPHPDGDKVREARVTGVCRRCRKPVDTVFASSLCLPCFSELEAQL